jgi:hypothetical protein
MLLETFIDIHYFHADPLLRKRLRLAGLLDFFHFTEEKDDGVAREDVSGSLGCGWLFDCIGAGCEAIYYRPHTRPGKTSAGRKDG